MRRIRGRKGKHKPTRFEVTRVLRALRDSVHGSLHRPRSNHGATEAMSRSIQSRRDTRQSNRLVPIRAGRTFCGPAPSSSRRCHSAARLMGLPLGVSIARLKGVRWRYCTRWDEGPAATLGMSLLRLGICQPNDWSGSAVDFVERGFNRFCHQNGAPEAKKVWVGDLRIADTLFELTEQERNQVEAGREDATRATFPYWRLRGGSVHPDRGDSCSP